MASIYGKDQANVGEADIKELEDIFGKLYTMEARRRLILFHDEKLEFQPKIFKLDSKGLNEILAKYRPPLPSIKQWFQVYEETEAKVEGLNQVQPEGNEDKRRRDRDLSKADRHTALNNKHRGQEARATGQERTQGSTRTITAVRRKMMSRLKARMKLKKILKKKKRRRLEKTPREGGAEAEVKIE